MSTEAAKKYYTGYDGGKRMNCAQSVLCAFKEKFGLGDELVEAFRAYGGGRAPAGLCGAYYAVKYIIEKHDVSCAEELEQFFSEHAGALECSSIKGIKKLSCVGCIEKCSEFLEKL